MVRIGLDELNADGLAKALQKAGAEAKRDKARAATAAHAEPDWKALADAALGLFDSVDPTRIGRVLSGRPMDSHKAGVPWSAVAHFFEVLEAQRPGITDEYLYRLSKYKRGGK